MNEDNSLIERIKTEISKDGGIIPNQNIIGYDWETKTYICLADLNETLIHGEDYL